ncbi:MAG: putative baseplate assembly protein [Candidatus Methanoperedens sp.]
MTIDPPKIDSRDQQMLYEQVRDLALYYCPEWKDAAAIESDKYADALMRIFSRMMEIIIQRLNKVPDKNFLTFLDMVGASLYPPGVARAPLTFTMAKGDIKYQMIPSGTQVATAQTAEKEAVVFETVKDLAVIIPKLAGAVSLSPEDDKWTDHTDSLFNNANGDVQLFNGQELVPHRLYLGHDELFGFKEETAISLDIEIPESANLPKYPQEWEVKWYYFDENSNPKLLPVDEKTIDADANLLGKGKKKITFKPVSGISKKTLTGFEKETGRQKNWTSNWIYAELKTPIPEKLTEITSIKAGLSIAPASAADPDLAFFNNVAIDFTKDFYVFGERPKFNDTFYIGSNEVFSKAGAAITIGITLSDGVDMPAPETVTLAWEFWDGKSWGIIGKTGKEGIKESHYNFSDSTKAFTLKGDVTFTCPEIEKKEINGQENYWIRVRIIEGNYGKDASYEAISIDAGQGKGKITSSGLVVTGVETDFKNQLSVGDSIIIASGETKIVTGITSASSLTIDSAFTDLKTSAPYNIKKIGWIYKPLTFKPPSISKLALKYTFDLTSNLQTVLTYNDFSYQVFVYYLFNWDEVPGKDSARLIEFLVQNYDVNWAKNAKIEKIVKIIKISDGKNSISLELDSVNMKVNLAINGLPTKDFVMKSENGKTNVYDQNKTSFKPFHPVEDEQPALYLAFDDDIADIPVTLFFPLLENMFTAVMVQAYDNPPVLAWEYWTGKNWSLLSVEDGTKNLTTMEMVQFLAPADLTERYCFEFEKEYCWIRARLDKGTYDNPPRLRGIYTNTIWAYNRITVGDEILGSSDGKTSQVFNFSHYPVLPGQKVLVMEISLTDEEKTTIRSEEGEDAILEIPDDAGNVIGYWVRWHEKNYLYASGPHSRHYVIDRNNGVITFGDGERGMIPPAEKDNIRCSYQYGGGSKGNGAEAQTINKLRTAFSFIKSVTNYEGADGGGEQETLDMLRERGPQTIKHRDRAVTYEDFEWLVMEASPKVAKVKCLPTTDPGKNFRPGWITMIVVPDERENPKPVPSQGLINEVQDYIFNRTSTYLTTYPSQITLIGPGYIQVGVEAKVHFTSVADAKIIEGKIIENLKRFFHPLIGGPEKEGWDFGRNVYISQVYEVIESTDGVDYVDELILSASVQMYKLILKENLILTDSYPEYSRVETSDGKLSFSLAEMLQVGEIDTLTVVGFKEGDNIILSHPDKYLFSWEDIPGSDNVELIDFLKKNYSIDWVKTGTIDKIDNYKTIMVSTDKNYLTLGLNTDQTKVNLIIDDGRTDAFTVKPENGKLKIYQDRKTSLAIRSVYHDGKWGDILEFQQSQIDIAYPVGSIIETSDERIKSFTLNEVPEGDISLNPIKIPILNTGDSFVLSLRDDPSKEVTGTIKKAANSEKIFIEKNYLVYSGEHAINTKPKEELTFRYLMNTNTKEIHDLNNEQPNCKLDLIQKDHMIFTRTLDKIDGYDYCRWCFGPEMSTR